MTNIEIMERWRADQPDLVVKIYCDMDGVTSNFRKKALEVAGVIPEQDPNDKKLRNDFWKAIGAHIKRGNKFFEDMEPMEDAFILWDYIKPYDATICSATGHIANAGIEKRNWVRIHLGVEVSNAAIFVRNGEDKGNLHAAPGRILIDDRKKILGPWVDKGGIGILHTSALDTIEQLKELGL